MNIFGLNIPRRLGVVLFIFLGLCGCVSQYNLVFLDLEKDDYTINPEGETTHLDFSSPGCSWEITPPSVDWISISPLTGYEDGHIPMIIQRNHGLIARQCCFTLTIKNGSATKSKDIFILQKGISTNDPSYTIHPPSTAGKSIKRNGKYYAELTWSKIDNAIGYHIYSSRYATQDFERIANLTNDTTYIADTYNGSNYYYVTAYSSIEESIPSEILRIYIKNNASLGNGDKDNSSNEDHEEEDEDNNENIKTSPSAPSGVTATINGNIISLEWSASDGALVYNVYRALSKDGKYSKIKSVETTYADDDTPAEGNNFYKITALNAYGESSYSEIVSCHFEKEPEEEKPQKPKAPTGLSATSHDEYIKLAWSSVSGSDYYNIYRSSSEIGSYSLIASENGTYVYDYNPINGYNYYKITAVNASGESNYSSVISCRYTKQEEEPEQSKPSVPSGLKVNNIGSDKYPTIKLTWNSSSNATGYNVYRSSSSSGGYTLLGNTRNCSYNDSYPMEGMNYYKVSATNDAGESSLSSYASYNNENATLKAPGKPDISISTSSSSVYLSWTCPSGANYGTPTEYKVYKVDPYTSNNVLLTSTKSRSYTDSDTHPGKNWYIVEALNEAGSAINYASSDEISLSRPSSFSATASSQEITCKWGKVAKATGYQIYYSDSPSGSYFILDDINDKEKTSKTIYYPAASGTSVYLKIRAYWIVGYETPVYSEFTSYKKVTF